MNEELKKAIYEAVKSQQKNCGCSFDIPEVELEHPSNAQFGDLSTNIAMKIGKQQGENPMKIAESLVKQLDSGLGQNDGKGMIERIEVVKPGFINFYLNTQYYQKGLEEILSAGKKYADLDAGKGQKVQVEFLSANPTGPLTLANGRGGFSGDVVANTLKKAGYDVEREYYFNDAGIQIKKVGVILTYSYIEKSAKNKAEKDIAKKIPEILEEQFGINIAYTGPFYEDLTKEFERTINSPTLYAKFYKKLEEEFRKAIDVAIKSGRPIPTARSYFDSKDIDVLKGIFEISIQFGIVNIEETIKETINKQMNIKFDSYFSEYQRLVHKDFDNPKAKNEVEKTIEELKKKKLTYEKDGALWLKTTEFGDDKDRVLIKEDKEKTYFANDIAYHWDKFSKRKFDKVIDLWGADHHGYVARMQAATEAMGFGGKLDIVIFQLVRLIKDGKEYRMSKRKGNYVTMDDLLTEIGAKDAADVARFFFVSKSFDTHMDFDLDLAKDKSEKNPIYYVKYAYARINGILRNTKVDFKDADLSLIKEPAEIDLIKKITELPVIVESVISDKKYPVHKFTYYISEIAEKFHKFYHDCKVISDDEELTKARLALVSATKTVLEITGQDILGIDLPERM